MARAGMQRQQIAAALTRQLTTARTARTLRRTSSSTDGGRKEGDTDVAIARIPADEAEAATAALRAAVAASSASPTPEPEPEPVEQQPAEADAPKPDWAILHNEHDVQVLQAECQKLVNAMAKLGVGVNMPRVSADAGSFAALRLLVLKNVCTEAEAQGEQFLAMRAILRGALQEAEVDFAKRTGQSIQAVHTPEIVVARR